MNADLSEIRRNIASLSERHRQLTVEAAAIYAGRKAGQAAEALYDDHAIAVRAAAAKLLNGSTPTELLMPPVTSREEAIRVEAEAITIVLKILQGREADAQQDEAARWVADNKVAWCELAKQTVLAAVRLHALEQKARDMIDTGLRGQWVRGLPMCNAIGAGSSLLGVGEPLRELLAAAREARIVTELDLERAENV